MTQAEEPSTVKEPTRGPRDTPPRLPALTVLCHPELRRVGEVARLDGLARVGGEARLSRVEPELSPPGVERARPLGDPHLSRRPILLRREERGVRVSADGIVLRVDGTASSGRLCADEELEAGVVLELGDRTALLLHYVGPRVERAPAHGLHGENEAIERLRHRISQVADLPVTVLVRGESGAGKELVAQALHRAGGRDARPFVAVNMASISAHLAASELFGHVKGAFTGAARDHVGYFQRADGGTLFLDEIGDVPAEVQAMLLRVLETSEVVPVGGSEPRRVDVRLVAATDADLEEAVASGKFRSPLLHRLTGYEVRVPPLRARRDDIGRLLVHFLARETARIGEAHRLEPRAAEDPPWLSAALVSRLVRHRWPGNVRELQNVVRQLVISSRGAAELVLDESLILRLGVAEATPPPAAAKREPRAIDDDTLLGALAANGWKPGATADALGISKTTLYALIDASPIVRKAKDLSREEIQAHLGDDLDATAAALRVSKRGLVLRMKELGI
jgi:two-component system, NtrC family, nitrogen regulation response regulator GlnG